MYRYLKKQTEEALAICIHFSSFFCFFLCTLSLASEAPFWTEKSQWVEEGKLKVTGIASNAKTREAGRKVAYENGQQEIKAFFRGRAIPQVFNQMTFESKNLDGTFNVYRLLYVSLEQAMPTEKETVVEQTAAVVARNPEDDTRLRQAVVLGDLERVKRLIKNGASPNAADDKGRTALFLVGKNTKVAHYLIVNGAIINSKSLTGETPLLYATQDGNAALAGLLISNNADLNAATTWGRTPVQAAVLRKNNSILAKLLEAGANTELADGLNRTPLYLAMTLGDKKAIDILLGHGADPNRTVNRSNVTTPLILAVESAKMDLIRSFLSKSSDRNAINHQGRSALGAAAALKRPDILRLLIDAGADPNIGEPSDQRPLFISAMQGDLEMLRLLVYKGAEPNIADPATGVTPLILAVKNRNAEMAALLVRRGARTDQPDNEGMSAQSYARQIGDPGISRALASERSK